MPTQRPLAWSRESWDPKGVVVRVVSDRGSLARAARALWLAGVLLGCGSELPAGPAQCIPGQAELCACGGTVQGTQTCLPDGSGFDTCSCAGGAGGAAGGTGNRYVTVGEPCATLGSTGLCVCGGDMAGASECTSYTRGAAWGPCDCSPLPAGGVGGTAGTAGSSGVGGAGAGGAGGSSGAAGASGTGGVGGTAGTAGVGGTGGAAGVGGTGGVGGAGGFGAGCPAGYTCLAFFCTLNGSFPTCNTPGTSCDQGGTCVANMGGSPSLVCLIPCN